MLMDANWYNTTTYMHVCEIRLPSQTSSIHLLNPPPSAPTAGYSTAQLACMVF